MSTTNRNIRKRTGKNIFMLIFILDFLILFSLFYPNNSNPDEYVNDNRPPIQAFSKEEFDPILDEKKHGFGNITVTNLKFEDGAKTEDIEGYYFSELHNKLLDDFYYNATVFSYKSTTFNKTVQPARRNNLNQSYLDRDTITVQINETLSVQYNLSKTTNPPYESPEGYMIYIPRLTPCRLKEVFVMENGSNSYKQINQENFSIDALNFLVFDFEKNFPGKDSNNFTISMIWEYNISITDWEIFQWGDTITIEKKEQEVSAKFNYNFKVVANRYRNDTSDIIEAYDLELSLKVNPAEKDSLYNHELKLNNKEETDNIELDKAINATFMANGSLFDLNFKADFTIKFLEPLDITWAIDRLVEGKDKRERVYFPSLISGPEHYYLHNLMIYERTITVRQVASNTSLYGRTVAYYDANVSWYQEYQNSLIFTKNATKKRGLKVIIPYMIKGETCPFSFKYSSREDLRIIITDIINMPLQGLEVKIFYYGEDYGTYISKDQLQPMAPAITNENGEIIIRNVPHGNYTIEIYQNGVNVFETEISSHRDINYVITNVPHFPVWILIFGTANGAFFLIGLVHYLINRKKR